MSRLTELDIKYISKLIGREASEIELKLIESVVADELEIRDYLEIIARLNKGAKRNPKAPIYIDEDLVMKSSNQLRIVNDKKELYNDGESVKAFDQDLSDKYLVIHGEELNEKNLNTVIGKLSDYNSIEYRIDANSENQIIFQTRLDMLPKNESKELSSSDLIFYRVGFGKNTKKNRNALNKFIENANAKELLISVNILNEAGISKALVKELGELGYGISIDKKAPFDDLMSTKGLSLVVLAVSSNSLKLKKLCISYELDFSIIGKINNEKILQFENKDHSISLPMSVFELQFDVNTKHFEQPQIEEYKSIELIKNARRLSYTNQLIKIFEQVISNNRLIKNSSSFLKEYAFVIETNSSDEGLFVTTADTNNLLRNSPRTSAKIAVANAARKMSCMGVKPQFVNIHNLFSNKDEQAKWYASEILQGQEEAVRELELTIVDRKTSAYNDNWQQHISVIGIGKYNSMDNISYKNDSDFISLLGSHRAELIGTEYNKYINNNISSVVPTVDLNMEWRLQDVVQQGVSTKLLKSATNVSMGGISTAVAMSLATSEPGIGAKIHLSRKLTNEELLFGETQGLVIVTLSEEDIMEFERICMSVGVPSTTIGRVTNNNQYTFNDLISLNVDKLKKFSR